MTHKNFLYLIRDIALPECNTGYVYMLISIRMRAFIYIGTSNSLKTRLRAHNSGQEALAAEPSYIRPYGLLAYICGCGCGGKKKRS